MKFAELPSSVEIPTLDNHSLHFLPEGPADWLYNSTSPSLSFRIVDVNGHWVESLDLETLQRIQEHIYRAAYEAESPKIIDVMAVHLEFERATIVVKADAISKFVHKVLNTRAEILASRFGAEISDYTLNEAFFSE